MAFAAVIFMPANRQIPRSTHGRPRTLQLLGAWACVQLAPSQVRGAAAASPWLQRAGSDLVSHTIRDAVAAGANVSAAQGAYGGATVMAAM